MPLAVTSDEKGLLVISQTGSATQDDPVHSIEMDYSKWPVEISLNVLPSDSLFITRVDTSTTDPDRKLKGRESPTHLIVNDIENLLDTIDILKIKGITPDIIALLNAKFEMAKSNRLQSPRPNKW